MRGKGQGARGKGLVALLVGLVLLVLLGGCASRPEGASPDYGRYLAAVERVAEMEAGMDRTIFSLTVGEEPVVLPAGAAMVVRAPLQALPVPEMWRDHGYEAELEYYGRIWSIVGGVAIPALGSAYGAYNNRKMIGDIMRYAGGATFNADNDSTIQFSGGWGDRTTGYHSGDYVEASPAPTTTTTTTTETSTSSSTSSAEHTENVGNTLPVGDE